jgi:hypothetical protein
MIRGRDLNPDSIVYEVELNAEPEDDLSELTTWNIVRRLFVVVHHDGPNVRLMLAGDTAYAHRTTDGERRLIVPTHEIEPDREYASTEAEALAAEARYCRQWAEIYAKAAEILDGLATGGAQP